MMFVLVSTCQKKISNEQASQQCTQQLRHCIVFLPIRALAVDSQ
jgi:hypothetical protein